MRMLDEARVTNKKSVISIFRVTTFSILASGLIYAAAKVEGLSNAFAPLIAIAGIVLIFAAWRDWQFGVKALLVIIIFEGAARKWFLSSASELVYFYKDFIMVALLLGYAMQRKKPPLLISRRLRLFFVVVLVLVLYSIAVLANPRAPHLLIGLLGLKSYFLYMPLAVIIPRMFTTKEKTADFLRWYLLICIPVIILGITQFVNADATSSINKYAWDGVTQELGPDASSIASFEDSAGNSYVRITGTFSYISGMAIYLPVVYALLLGFLSLDSSRQLPRIYRWLYYSILTGVVATSFMTGSRSSIVHLTIITIVFFGLTSHKNLKQRLIQFGLMGVMIVIALTLIFPTALDALKNRAFGSDEEIEEGSGRIINIFRLSGEEASYAGAFGYGVGATQNYVPALISRLELANKGEQIPPIHEDEPYRVIIELGIIGYILYSLLRLSLIITLWKISLSIKDVESKSVAIAASAVLTIHIFIGGAVIVHTQNVLQWFLVGMCLALSNCEALRSNKSRTRLWRISAPVKRLIDPAISES